MGIQELTSTYRMQLNHRFPFGRAAEVAPILAKLGISDVYASPFLAARRGSLHGYDVVDPTHINDEVGGEQEFTRFSDALAGNGMGLIVDVVPNHMCIMDPANRWWFDVLENGPSSPYAPFFDIDWSPLKVDLENKVLLPFLGEQYGKALESQTIRIEYEAGAFVAHVYEFRMPVAPRSWRLILEPVLENLRLKNDDTDPAIMEVESILTALSHLPSRSETDPEKIRERHREKEIIKKRMAALTEQHPAVDRALQHSLASLNGEKGKPSSFDRLEALLNEQAYRLCFWRVAADEINYRRFFDINELAAIRVEEPEVFKTTHELPLRWAENGNVRGFRIDHVDGLYDPKQYLTDLREAVNPPARRVDFYLAVEKILEPEEHLMPDWPAQGTTGYDFLNQLNGLFVDGGSRAVFLRIYREFAGINRSFSDVLATSKKLIMLVSNASEMRVLANYLDRISEQHRWSRDFTLDTLRFAVREVVAYFPVYRTYVRPEEDRVSAQGRQMIDHAIREAKRHNPATDASVFDFIRDVLCLEDPEGLDKGQVALRRQFVMRFQQLTGPIMAKGLEDTAFYRYFPLASLNEVGGRPDHFGVSMEEFHQRNRERAEAWPRAMLATTTHDTKRSEDVRARINVLSEIPEAWERALERWTSMNERHKIAVDGVPSPDPNHEYLLYQTLVGVWPFQAMSEEGAASLSERVKNYMVKAAREAKIHTSWIKPDEAYEKSLVNFVDRLLTPGPDNKFIADMETFLTPVRNAGVLNSLAQVFLKTTSPGIPDFYQGTERWSFTLVDPDNRREVDYGRLRDDLEKLSPVESVLNEKALEELMERHADGRVKLWLTRHVLHLRRARPDLFLKGSYAPLSVSGSKAKHACAFRRDHDKESVVALAARFFMELGATGCRLAPSLWADTAVELDESYDGLRLRNLFTGKIIVPQMVDGRRLLFLREALTPFPVALLEPTKGDGR